MNRNLLTLFLQINKVIPQSFSDKFESLRNDIAKTSLRVTFQAYMGLMLFATLVSGIIGFSFTMFATYILFKMLFPSAIFVSVSIGLLASLASFGVCCLYPTINISSRTRKIEANLPLTANFMAVLASAGMPPERIFHSLANVGDEFSIGEEARRMIGDMELLGLDLNAALRNASTRSASRKFGALLNGIVTTSHMGGDLSAFLREESEKYKKVRVASMKSYLESLAGMAEVYVSFMIALPLALVVMLSIMSFLGGGASLLGNINPQILLMLLAFVITPVGCVVLLLMIDSMTPPR
jgi:flagellar protein FlaJ